MNSSPTALASQALAIAQLHRSLQLGPVPSLAQVQADTPEGSETFRATLWGARLLGFIEADARVVARAWEAQSQRQGGLDIDAWPSEADDFQLTPSTGPQAFPACPSNLGLYAVLPDAAWVGRMARAGVPTVQLRFKSDDRSAIAREVRAAVDAVQGTETLLFINDHWREALEAGVYGVHLGQEDLDAIGPELAQIRQAGVRLGLSSHGYAEMLKAAAVQPSYIAMGAVFPTTLKAMPTAPQGLGRLGAYAQLMRGRSVVAIGGIDEARFPMVRATGVGSVAVVRAITAAPDPEAAARRLMNLLGR